MKPYTYRAADAELEAALARGDNEEAWRVAAEMDRLEKPKPVSTLSAALWYASVGLPVFPLQPRSKRPYSGSHGLLDASCDPAVIRAAFHTYSNIGIATGHRIDAIDFDGPDAHAAWTAKFGERTWSKCGVTVLAIVSTPRPGGLHLWVPSRPGATSRKTRAGKHLPHVDYRGPGGYVVAPPSVTEQGAYHFVRSLDPDRLP